jgi:hypothetical protein
MVPVGCMNSMTRHTSDLRSARYAACHNKSSLNGVSAMSTPPQTTIPPLPIARGATDTRARRREQQHRVNGGRRKRHRRMGAEVPAAPLTWLNNSTLGRAILRLNRPDAKDGDP